MVIVSFIVFLAVLTITHYWHFISVVLAVKLQWMPEDDRITREEVEDAAADRSRW